MGRELTGELFRSEAIEARRMRVEGEIVLAQPPRVRYAALGIAFFILLLVAWLALSSYSRTESARGYLTTRSASAKVVALRPGQIAELFVAEGDVVQQGQRLATIRTEERDGGGASAIANSLEAIAGQRALSERQVRLAQERAESERARLSATISGLDQQDADLRAQIELQGQAVASARNMWERLEGLTSSGFISQVEIERRRQTHIGTQQELARLRQQRNAVAADRRRANAELDRIDADASSEVVAARSAAATLTLQEARLRSERSYSLTAPTTGRVAAMQASLGRTVESSVPLMEIVPENSELKAQIYVPSRAIGFVRPGQDVRLLYDAFPYQRFGSFSGRVTRVSNSVIDPRQLAAPLEVQEPVYQVEVALQAQSIDAFAERVALRPGMTLTASLILDRRSLLDWLLTPLNAVLRRGS